MTPFNLDLYLQNPNLPVVTRDGRKVRIICTNRKQRDVSYPIIALVGNEEGAEFTQSFTKDGKWYGEEAESNKDLFFEDYTPGKHEGWVNIIRNVVYNEAFCGKIYTSKEEAERYANSATLATAKIEWEEEL